MLLIDGKTGGVVKVCRDGLNLPSLASLNLLTDHNPMPFRGSDCHLARTPWPIGGRL